jgi:hypothetical protein
MSLSDIDEDLPEGESELLVTLACDVDFKFMVGTRNPTVRVTEFAIFDENGDEMVSLEHFHPDTPCFLEGTAVSWDGDGSAYPLFNIEVRNWLVYIFNERFFLSHSCCNSCKLLIY